MLDLKSADTKRFNCPVTGFNNPQGLVVNRAVNRFRFKAKLRGCFKKAGRRCFNRGFLLFDP
jgi:hypothetical protein